jgi:predicted transcriptional regulator
MCFLAILKNPLDDSYRPTYLARIDDNYRLNRNQPMQSQPSIGREEMEILRYIADHDPVSVRDVATHISATKGHVRTTVLNVMERLRKKGYLRRRKAGGIYQYSPSVPKADLLRSLVRDFVARTLGGSLSPFVAYLSQECKLSEEELVDSSGRLAGPAGMAVGAGDGLR